MGGAVLVGVHPHQGVVSAGGAHIHHHAPHFPRAKAVCKALFKHDVPRDLGQSLHTAHPTADRGWRGGEGGVGSGVSRLGFAGREMGSTCSIKKTARCSASGVPRTRSFVWNRSRKWNSVTARAMGTRSEEVAPGVAEGKGSICASCTRSTNQHEMR